MLKQYIGKSCEITITFTTYGNAVPKILRGIITYVDDKFVTIKNVSKKGTESIDTINLNYISLIHFTE